MRKCQAGRGEGIYEEVSEEVEKCEEVGEGEMYEVVSEEVE